ncbi:hypothetical protein SISNIDRAFT_473483 [Sistotremastrum niveocremeum HHB9708]|uniref:M protein, serotype 2.1 n=1 Tax=Sistotremastrum niveocremeum HHB9708 TaxID=1314777 RepID=A0A164XKC8_9AGAM|nr:hypothetical protein SISNIDRAFT_473483 [Sistotremastrum niveocremeum HHB9708]
MNSTSPPSTSKTRRLGRTSPPTTSVSPPGPSSLIAKGGTARSAVPPRAKSSLPARRTSLHVSPSRTASSSQNSDEARDGLLASLKRETEEKEELLVRLQNKEQTLSSLTSDNDNLLSALNAAEGRLTEFYAEQSRMDDEMAAKGEVIDKLRDQVRELEKEKRDAIRRYNEQTQTFDAERQAFYDNEQHLKSRIQSLTKAKKTPVTPITPEQASDVEEETQEEPSLEVDPPAPTYDNGDEENEPAEMTSLRLELSTLATSHASLQSTLQLLQTQLLDLKRVNNELQEENESYNILLREKTLTGQFDILRRLGNGDSGNADDEPEKEADARSFHSTARSTLNTLPELEELHLDGHFQDLASELDMEHGRGDESPRLSNRSGRRARTGASSPTHPRGETLAGLPITGPGLDLAAELGRAENRDVLDGRIISGSSEYLSAAQQGKSLAEAGESSTNLADESLRNEIKALKDEIKALKDANKALSLYASKIIDRIIAQEGFEHVLAADYDKKSTTTQAPPPPPKRPRPPTSFLDSWKKPTNPTPDPAPEAVKSPVPVTPVTAVPAPPTPDVKRSRRSMSFDWKALSPFGGEKKPEPTNLRPLALRPGAPPIVGARKLETHEDEEDRQERERLQATMKLMGIDKPMPPPPPVEKSATAPAPSSTGSGSSTPSIKPSGWSLFRSKSNASAEASPRSIPADLTTQALEQVEVSEKMKQLDERERELSEEIAKGSSGGYTELTPRSLSEEWRSRRGLRIGSAGGSDSASTVWSAGREHDDSGEMRLSEDSLHGAMSP